MEGFRIDPLLGYRADFHAGDADVGAHIQAIDLVKPGLQGIAAPGVRPEWATAYPRNPRATASTAAPVSVSASAMARHRRD